VARRASVALAIALLLVAGCDRDDSRRNTSSMTQSTFWLPPTSSTARVRGPVSSSCQWRPAEVNDAAAAGFEATVVGFTNVTAEACRRPSVRSVATTNSGRLVAAHVGSFPVGRAPSFVPPSDRIELVVSSVSED
jgi:hypothetical protein